MHPEHATYEPHLDAWVIYNNSVSEAREIKRLHPTETVLLFDREHNTYTPYKIKIKIKKPIISNGKLVYEEGETIEV